MSQSEFVIVTGKSDLRGIVEISRTRAGAPQIIAQLESGQQVYVPLHNHGKYQVLMQLDSGEHVLVPGDALALQEDGTYYLPFSRAELEQVRGMGIYHEDDALVLPVVAEELDVRKRKVETGGVRITKRVHEWQEIVDEPLLEEEIKVERVIINRVVDGALPVRYEGDTMIVSLLEEVLVVEKRLMLKEEVHITKRRSETHKPQRVTLRSEEAAVERFSGKEQQEGGDYKDFV